MKKALVLALCLVGPGCFVFGEDFEIHYEAVVLDVQTLTDAAGTSVRCQVLLTATADGNDGDRGKWGESVWTLKAIDGGTTLSVRDQSAALMGAFFGTSGIEAGESITSRVIPSVEAEPFTWQFSLNYRKPNGRRATTGLTTTCAP